MGGCPHGRADGRVHVNPNKVRRVSMQRGVMMRVGENLIGCGESK